jgi:two-component system KDP operon response regulator KdpE
MSAGRVLIVDDEEAIRRSLARALSVRNYQVQEAADGPDAVAAAAASEPDLIVLDLNLPTMDGLTVTREIRARSAVPILVLSVREDEADKVAALDLGADDYLTKPFGIDELLARVRALMRRASTKDTASARIFRTGGIEIDMAQQAVRRDGDPVRLTKTEWELLDAMSAHPGKLLTHRWLLERVWGPGYAEDVEVLRVFVSQLRKKIEPDPARPTVIVTDPGIGYRWSLRPAEAAVEAR